VRPLEDSAPHWPGDRGGHLWPKDREVVASDDARIRYTVRGNPDGPWVVFLAGFMCPDNFWQYVGPLLFDRYRCVFLNYRGVGASTDPRPPGYRGMNLRPGDYTIEKFASDVASLLAAEDATEVTLIGHSMGCQVALETWRQSRDRVAALALVTGPHTSPLHSFYGSKLGTHLFPVAYFGLPAVPRPLQKQIGKLLRLPIAMPVARMIRALGPQTPPEAMAGYFEHFGNVDPMIVLKIARGMHEFDSSPWLHDVSVPTLIVVGSEDRFSPPELGEVVLQHVPDSEIVTIVGGTHGAIIEFPAEIHDVLSDFLHRVSGHPAVPRTGDPDRVIGPRRHGEADAPIRLAQ
jgi:pimeloyl-ACP methyl ester carboxylesterase